MNYNYLDMKIERLIDNLTNEELVNMIDNLTKEYYLNCFNKNNDRIVKINKFLHDLASNTEYNDYINYSLVKSFNLVLKNITGSKIELYDPKYIDPEDSLPDLFNEEEILKILEEESELYPSNKVLKQELKKKEQYIKDLEEELYHLKGIEGVILDE